MEKIWLQNFPMIKEIVSKAKIQAMRTNYLQYTVHDNTYYYNIQRNPKIFSERRKTLMMVTEK